MTAATLGPLAGALALGAVGGAGFWWAGLPLPWMTGAMCATTIASLSGVPLAGPVRLRTAMIAVLGLMLGSAFTPDVVDKLPEWPASLGAMAIFVVIVGTGLYFVLRRWAGFSMATAYFSAAPGGLTQMVLVGTSVGGDEKTISLMHTVRLMLTVLVIPLWFRIFEGYVPGTRGGDAWFSGVDHVEAAILGVCAVAGVWFAARLRLPAPALIGPTVLSAAVHFTGLSQAGPPDALVATAQVVLGAGLGCRFAGVPVRSVIGVIGIAASATAALMASAAIAAGVLHQTLGLPFGVVLLAFSPGGVVEMCLISLAMGVDIAFVSTHHFLRIFLIVLLAPLVFALVRRAGGPA